MLLVKGLRARVTGKEPMWNKKACGATGGGGGGGGDGGGVGGEGGCLLSNGKMGARFTGCRS